MKCQLCDKAATHHVTEMEAGQPVEYHLCEGHIHDFETKKPDALPKPATGFAAFWDDPGLREALRSSSALQQMAAYYYSVRSVGNP